MNIFISQKDFDDEEEEIVELKGLGHPDTLADALAEKLSREYSKYTKNKYGAILHHNFDKIGILGGASYVTFGKGYLTHPIRILLNGRASTKFGDEEISVKKLVIQWTKKFFNDSCLLIDVEKDLEFHYNLSNQSSPGKTNEKESLKGTRRYWFTPRGLDDLQELKNILSNDTALGVGYAPYSNLEKFVIKIESTLNSAKFKKRHPWMGSDIKIMGFRHKKEYYITLCVPQISRFVKNVKEYKDNLEIAKKEIHNIAVKHSIKKLYLSVNTRDNFDTLELYLTAIGSSIESGDEGVTGRGNRINGIISPLRPLSIEGVYGKNPVYHVGKLYYLAANEIAKKIYRKFNTANEIYLISQSGRPLLDPWLVIVKIPNGFKNLKLIENFISSEISKITNLTEDIINSKYSLC